MVINLITDRDEGQQPVTDQDATFIAAARSDVPRLLADLHRYRDWCKRLANELDDHEMWKLAEGVRVALEGKPC